MTVSSDVLMDLLTLTLTVDQWGNRRYLNSHGQLHRQHGSALECANGTKHWFLNGQSHRTDGPAIEANGYTTWYQNDQLHRIDGPAMELANGAKYWYLDGQPLSEKEFHERLK